MSWASCCGSSQGEDEDKKSLEQCFILEPFPKDQLRPLKWTHILATLDVCINEATQKSLYDKDGHDLKEVSLNMLQAQISWEIETIQTAYHRAEEILVCDKSSLDEDGREIMYDASLKLSNKEKQTCQE